MSKKLSLDDLQKKRDALDVRIKELQEAELRSVAKWVQERTGCFTIEQLQKNGWSLVKQKPAATEAARPGGEAAAAPQP